jgi:hypothetical protein
MLAAGGYVRVIASLVALLAMLASGCFRGPVVHFEPYRFDRGYTRATPMPLFVHEGDRDELLAAGAVVTGFVSAEVDLLADLPSWWITDTMIRKAAERGATHVMTESAWRQVLGPSRRLVALRVAPGDWGSLDPRLRPNAPETDLVAAQDGRSE